MNSLKQDGLIVKFSPHLTDKMVYSWLASSLNKLGLRIVQRTGIQTKGSKEDVGSSTIASYKACFREKSVLLILISSASRSLIDTTDFQF